MNEKEQKSKTEKKAAPQASAHGFYNYIKEAWKNPTPEFTVDLRHKMTAWRAGNRITKIEKPSRLDKARALGYKAKKGFIMFRVVIERGGRHKSRPTVKRRSKRFSVKKILRMNYRWVAESRVQRKYPSLEILNSYPIGKDGIHYFFEIIAVDPNMPEIKSDKNINWICESKNKNRVLRGLTSAAKKSRGLRHKSPNLKVRPSLRAWRRRGR